MGKIIAVNISERRGTPKKNIHTARVIRDFGMEGDAHGGNWHRQVSLLSYEKIQEFNARGAMVEDGAFGENLIVQGFDLKNLPIGTRFRCNTVVLELTQIGKECHSGCEIFQRMGECIMPREGVFARVLEGGVISEGDEISIIEKVTEENPENTPEEVAENPEETPEENPENKPEELTEEDPEETPGGLPEKERLNHFDKNGNAVMVDISGKFPTSRKAVARGTIRVNAAVMKAILQGTVKKGDVLGVARIAGIMGVKQTSSLIPLCHPLLLQKCSVDFEIEEEKLEISAVCSVKTEGQTGVEMEALTGVSAALLTIYDMCKAMDKSMEIGSVHLVEKTGGKSGTFHYEKGAGND